MPDHRPELVRRSFLSLMSAGAAALGTAFGTGVTSVSAQSATPEAGSWKPARHAEDDWLDRIPGRHRFFFDTITPDGLGMALRFANNFFTANQTGYNLGQSELGVVICMRHQSTGFAYSDAMWAKYGEPLAARAAFKDPKTRQTPTINAFMGTGYGPLLSNNGVLLDSLLKSGVHLAVCQMATRANATAIAQKTGGKVDDIFQELVSNLVPNSHMVPAGIVAVNRAQERGYAFSYGG